MDKNIKNEKNFSCVFISAYKVHYRDGTVDTSGQTIDFLLTAKGSVALTMKV
ncbi:hypothetical protein K7H99_21385 (plasmid) [Providencia rettgeri]|nr:hypothetical protein K7H99_21385 [Providencia rettgeri]